MKTILLIIIGMLSVGFSGITFAEQPTNCTFGDKSIPLENIFKKDLAVKAFTEKHQNATRSIAANESGSMKNQLVIQAQNDNIKETLEIKFNTDTKGCYIPASYHYSYDDGIIDVTIRNSVANFTEILNLIKSNNKSIDDFYPDNCDFIDLDVTLTSGKVFGACKGTTSKFITILIDAPSNGVLEVDIPIQMVYSLPSIDCKPTGDFLVISDDEETRYEIMPTDIGNLVKVEFAEGFHKIRIMGTVILPDPSPAQYCGIVEGYFDKKYLAPLAQTDNGIALEFIRCNEGLVLIQKYDDTPACIKPESISKLMERGWTEQFFPSCTGDRITCFNQDASWCDSQVWNCGDAEGIFDEIITLPNKENQSGSYTRKLEGIIIDQRISKEHEYHFLTRQLLEFNTGSLGIRLEGIDNLDDLDGKYVKLFGDVSERGEEFINVNRIHVLDSIVPIGIPFGKVTKQVSINELYQNPDKYYNQIIVVKGELREHDVDIMVHSGVGCNNAKYTTSDEFVSEFISSQLLYDDKGDKHLGVRIGSADNVGISKLQRLPLVLKNNVVEITGTFVPTIKDDGNCFHTIYKSGYILTDFVKIKLLE